MSEGSKRDGTGVSGSGGSGDGGSGKGGSSDGASSDGGSGKGGSSDGGSGKSGSGKGGSGPGGSESNWLEWTVAAVGAAIVLGTLGFLIVQILGGAADPPALTLSLGEPERRAEQLMVPVEVRNDGGMVAMDAVVEICRTAGDCAQLHFAYVPHGSKRTGLVGFSSPPSGPLSSRVVSFREP